MRNLVVIVCFNGKWYVIKTIAVLSMITRHSALAEIKRHSNAALADHFGTNNICFGVVDYEWYVLNKERLPYYCS